MIDLNVSPASDAACKGRLMEYVNRNICTAIIVLGTLAGNAGTIAFYSLGAVNMSATDNNVPSIGTWIETIRLVASSGRAIMIIGSCISASGLIVLCCSRRETRDNVMLIVGLFANAIGISTSAILLIGALL